MVCMSKKIIYAIIALLAAIFLTACNNQPAYYPEAEDYVLADDVYVQPSCLESDHDASELIAVAAQTEEKAFEDIFGELRVLWYDGNGQYGWRFYGGKCALYLIEDNGLSVQRLALIEPMFPFWDKHRGGIFDFGIIDEWIILSVGEFQGSGWYFFGDFVRMRKDGSELEHFWLTNSHSFHIIGDWIYYYYWCHQPLKQEGIYRIRPDGSDKEYMGHILHNIILYAEDGYVYATQATDEIISPGNPVTNLIHWNPGSGEIITLFHGSILPEIDYALRVEYRGVEVHSEYILFGAYITGDAGNLSRLITFDLYSAHYQVDKDGGNLILLNEENLNE